MLKRKVLPIVLCTLGVLAFSAGPANAHLQGIYDGGDVSSPLDIKVAGVGHTNRLVFGGGIMVARFRNATLGPKGDFYVDFDTAGDNRPDYYVWVNNSDGRLTARVFRYRQGGSYAVGSGSAWRYDSKTVNFRFPRGLINVSGGYFKWFANSRYSRGINQYGNMRYAWDYAPDRGGRGHALKVSDAGTISHSPSAPQGSAELPLGLKAQASSGQFTKPPTSSMRSQQL